MKLLSGLISIGAVICVVLGQCRVSIRYNLTGPEPVFFKGHSLMTPNGPWLYWAAGESTLISCGDGKLSSIGKNLIDIKCISGTTFEILGTNYQSSALTCSRSLTGSIYVASDSCAGGAGQTRNIGYWDGKVFVTYIQSCYNVATASVIYTRHVLPGAAIRYAITEADRPSFKSEGTPMTVSPRTSYEQAQSKARLVSLLGPVTAKRINDADYLARGHMAPNSDGIFRSWRGATFFYVNAVPQWQSVNNGNWKRVEAAVQTKAATLKEDLLIFTGAYEVLTLANDRGVQTPITLENGRIQVPKWTWKVVKATKRKTGIAFVTSNNPFRTGITAAEMICPNICGTSGWGKPEFRDFKKGYTYCCTVDSLKEKITTIPVEARVTGVLKY